MSVRVAQEQGTDSAADAVNVLLGKARSMVEGYERGRFGPQVNDDKAAYWSARYEALLAAYRAIVEG